jgi:hypothetical protein
LCCGDKKAENHLEKKPSTLFSLDSKISSTSCREHFRLLKVTKFTDSRNLASIDVHFGFDAVYTPALKS